MTLPCMTPLTILVNYGAIISDSCELVSVTEEVFYPVQMIVDY